VVPRPIWGQPAAPGGQARKGYDVIAVETKVPWSPTLPRIDPFLPEEVGERFEFSWIVPKDRPWQVGDRLAIKFFEFGELLQ
jgi:hypothetical protein